MRKRYLHVVLIILLLIGVVFLVKRTHTPGNETLKAEAQTPPTANNIIDQIAVLTPGSGGADVQNEIQDLVTGLVNDPKDYNGIGWQDNQNFTTILYLRGRNTSTLAPLLPLLPGSIGDTTTLKGKLAARLKNEVQNYLLQPGEWAFETAYDQPTQGTVPWYTPLPNTGLTWNHRYNVGPYWEKFYAIWAYAYYTGDWTTVQNALSFLSTQYNNGDQTYSTTPTSTHQFYVIENAQVFRDDPVHLALGLIGYTRILHHFASSQEATIRAKAQTALGYLNNTAFTDRSFANGQVYTQWDKVPGTIRYDYPPCQDVQPEIGRWLQATQQTSVTNRINEALTATLLGDRYNTGINNYSGKSPSAQYDEGAWGLPATAYEIYDCQAWVLQTDPTTLRKFKPWPVMVGITPKYRDMLYQQALYALLSRYSTVNWVTVNN